MGLALTLTCIHMKLSLHCDLYSMLLLVFVCADTSCRSRLAQLNEKLTQLERRVEYIEARVCSRGFLIFMTVAIIKMILSLFLSLLVFDLAMRYIVYNVCMFYLVFQSVLR